MVALFERIHTKIVKRKRFTLIWLMLAKNSYTTGQLLYVGRESLECLNNNTCRSRTGQLMKIYVCLLDVVDAPVRQKLGLPSHYQSLAEFVHVLLTLRWRHAYVRHDRYSRALRQHVTTDIECRWIASLFYPRFNWHVNNISLNHANTFGFHLRINLCLTLTLRCFLKYDRQIFITE